MVGESRRAIRRAAKFCDGWCLIDVNPKFPIDSPERLSHGMDLLSHYAQEAGRSSNEIEIIYRTHRLELSMSPDKSSVRPQFVGNSEQVAGDICRYQEIGVNNLMVDIARISSTLEDMLGKMADFASKVWPRV